MDNESQMLVANSINALAGISSAILDHIDDLFNRIEKLEVKIEALEKTVNHIQSLEYRVSV